MIPEVWQPEFIAVREVPGHGICGVQGFIFTCGLLTEMAFTGLEYTYARRYCYPSRTEAVRALKSWDGQGDPPGDWIKEKVSERQRLPDRLDL